MRKIVLTLTALSSAIDRGARYQDIIHDRKDTLTPNPRSIFMTNGAIVQDSGLIQMYTATVDRPGKR